MDFEFTDEQRAFRKEVRAFLRETLPPDYTGGDTETPEGRAEIRRIHRLLAAKGWLVMAWPKEYGGGGAGILEQVIFNEEYGYARGPYVGPGVTFIGPTIFINGNDVQKRRHLPAIASASVQWCQGFSEPGSGSDLASLQTRAVEDGDEYVVNGTKIWNSFGHYADWCYLAVRTDTEAPKHRGISVLLVDMKSPGITVQPIITMDGEHHFNQVFFDDVRVPRSHVLGPLNRGWYVMATTLDFERSMVAGPAAARRDLEELIAYAAETTGPDGLPIGKDPTIAAKLAQMAVEIEVARLLSYQTASVQLHGRIPNREGSVSKLYGSELGQRLAALGLALLGPAGVVREGDKWAAMRGRYAKRVFREVSHTIGGGTSEIQRNVIATRGLGMPR
jgi:alkylation response protein AidB-like acyl-CoA dehydrogenase